MTVEGGMWQAGFLLGGDNIDKASDNAALSFNLFGVAKATRTAGYEYRGSASSKNRGQSQNTV